MMLDVLYIACMLKRGFPASFVTLQFPGGVPGNSFALPDVDVVCSKETATGLSRFEKGQDRPSCKQWERKRLTSRRWTTRKWCAYNWGRHWDSHECKCRDCWWCYSNRWNRRWSLVGRRTWNSGRKIPKVCPKVCSKQPMRSLRPRRVGRHTYGALSSMRSRSRSREGATPATSSDRPTPRSDAETSGCTTRPTSCRWSSRRDGATCRSWKWTPWCSTSPTICRI